MAISLIRSITIENTNDPAKSYDHLSPIKQMAYNIQQLLYCDYVSMFAGSMTDGQTNSEYFIAAPLLLREYRQFVMNRVFAIPKNDFNVGKYVFVHEAMTKLANCSMPDADDLMDIFLLTDIANDGDINIPKEFLLPFVYSVNGTKVENTRLPFNMDAELGYFNNPVIFTPKFCHCEEHGLRLCLIAEEAFQVPSFKMDDYFDMAKSVKNPYRYLAMMNWRGKTFTHLIGFLTQFSLEHDSHVMQSNGVCTIGDLSYDIVTNSNYCRDCQPSNFQSFVKALKYIAALWNIEFDDLVLLGEILRKSGCVDQELIAYFQKAKDEITVSEMEAFNSSIFSSFIKNVVALEAADNTDDEEETDDNQDEDAQAGTSDDTSNPDEPAVDDGTDTSGGDGSTDDSDDGSVFDGSSDDLGVPDEGMDDTSGEDSDSTEEEDTPEKKVARTIPPATDGIMLELMNPENETLSDYLYRKEFLIRVQDLLRDPSTARCSSQTLFMLKQWATKWLFIFSVPSLKSFLRNINFSFMPKQ